MSDYIVLKIEDVNKYLGSNSRRKLHLMIETIERGRLSHGIPKLDCHILEGQAILKEDKPAPTKVSESTEGKQSSRKIIRKKVTNVKNKG